MTLFIVALWRAWWVNQDRYFRRHLSMELSNERYWTTDGRPRDLETSFLQDFLSVFKRSGALTTTNSTIVGGGLGGGGGGGGNRAKEARKNALSIDNSEAQQQQQSSGFVRRGWTVSPRTSLAKDDEKIVEDSEGDVVASSNTRFRKISFAGGALQPDAASAV